LHKTKKEATFALYIIRVDIYERTELDLFLSIKIKYNHESTK